MTVVWRVFGSKTTHCEPSSIDSSIISNSRRTFTYFHATVHGASCRPEQGALGLQLPSPPVR